MNEAELREEIERKENVILTLIASLENSKQRIDNVEKERQGLLNKVKQLKGEYNTLERNICETGDITIADLNQMAIEEIDSVCSVLEFYANPKNYQPIGGDNKFTGQTPVVLDGGFRAQSRLTKASGIRAFSLVKVLTDKVASQRKALAKMNKKEN